MVRKSKRIQSIQRRESSRRTTKPRAAPLPTITTSPATSSHSTTCPDTQASSYAEEADSVKDVRQRHKTGIAPVTLVEGTDDVTPTQMTSGCKNVNIAMGESSSIRHDNCSLTEQEEQELMQRYLQAGTDTILTDRPICSPVVSGLDVMGYVQMQPDVDLFLSLSRDSQKPRQLSSPEPAADPTLELVQNAISSVVSSLSSESHSSSESKSDSEPVDSIHKTAHATISQLEVIFCMACFERIKALEEERKETQEDLERSYVEREQMMKRLRELEAKLKGSKKARFVPGC